MGQMGSDRGTDPLPTTGEEILAMAHELGVSASSLLVHVGLGAVEQGAEADAEVVGEKGELI